MGNQVLDHDSSWHPGLPLSSQLSLEKKDSESVNTLVRSKLGLAGSKSARYNKHKPAAQSYLQKNRTLLMKNYNKETRTLKQYSCFNLTPRKRANKGLSMTQTRVAMGVNEIGKSTEEESKLVDLNFKEIP